MRRIAAIGLVALGVLALLPAGARAGGAAWFEFRRPYYSPGDVAVGRARVWFASEERAGMVADGRFVAYLLPEDRWLRPPSVPDAAIPLGPVTFSSPDENTAIATLEFTVPDVATGDWNVSVCNQPCTESMIGDLLGGSIRVARSPAMAGVLGLEDRLNLTRDMARYDGRRMERQLDVLRVQFDALRTEMKLLEQRLDRQQRPPREEPTPPASFPAPIGWILVALTVLFGLVAFRPRRTAAMSPDPPEIERIDDREREPVP